MKNLKKVGNCVNCTGTILTGEDNIKEEWLELYKQFEHLKDKIFEGFGLTMIEFLKELENSCIDYENIENIKLIELCLEYSDHFNSIENLFESIDDNDIYLVDNLNEWVDEMLEIYKADLESLGNLQYYYTFDYEMFLRDLEYEGHIFETLDNGEILIIRQY